MPTVAATTANCVTDYPSGEVTTGCDIAIIQGHIKFTAITT
jgi:hypothetical protein